MNSIPLRLFLSLPCLGLSSCKDIKAVQSERDGAKSRIEEITQQNVDLESKILALKGAAPQGIVSQAAAETLAQKTEQDLKHLDDGLARAVKSYEETEKALQTLEQDVARLRKLSPP